MNDTQAANILKDAEQYRDSASWVIYTEFKNRLIDAGCYGHERELCNILNI